MIPNEIRLKRFFYKKLMDSILFLKKNKSSHCAALGPPNIANARVVTGGGVFWDATGRKRSRKADASASIVFRSTSGYFFARFFLEKNLMRQKKMEKSDRPTPLPRASGGTIPARRSVFDQFGHTPKAALVHRQQIKTRRKSRQVQLDGRFGAQNAFQQHASTGKQRNPPRPPLQ